jgi:hypothetical protein
MTLSAVASATERTSDGNSGNDERVDKIKQVGFAGS